MTKVSFFCRQEALRRITIRLLVLTVLGSIGVGSIGGAVAAWISIARATSSGGLVPSGAELWPVVGLGVAVTLGSTVLVVAARLALLHFSARSARDAFAARELATGTTGTCSAEDRALANVVEEVAIAAAVPVPRIFVLEDDATINSFALAQSGGRGILGVTDGARKSLTRDELQALVAHEFAHLANGDAAINIRLLALIQGFRWLYDASVTAVGWPARTFRSGGVALFLVFYLTIVFGLFFVLGLFGVAISRFMQAAIARNREYLADASAVQFTRSTRGLIGALTKAGACRQSARRGPTHKAAFMLFVSPYRARSWLLRTHPKIEDRITAAVAMTPGVHVDTASMRDRGVMRLVAKST